MFCEVLYALTLSRCGNDDVEVEVFYIVGDEIINKRVEKRS